MPTFADFEIWVGAAASAGGGWPVQVFTSPAGPATGRLTLDLAAEELQTVLTQVRSIDPDLELRKVFGRRLFDALFAGKILEVWQASRGRVDGGEADGLRLRLWIEDPALAALPWELLWSGQFLATDARLVVSRYLPVREPARFTLPARLKVLLVVERPAALPAISQAEVDRLTAALTALAPGVGHQVLFNPPLAGIQSALQQEPHVLHYLGHGAGGKLLLVGEDGQSVVPVASDELAQLFLGRPSLRLVVLNACNSAQADPGGLFSGIGPALVGKSLPAVIAMQYPFVQLDTAGRFSRAFYGALANGKAVDVAVNEARQLLSAQGLADRDWSTPVLYMGTRSGRILSPLGQGAVDPQSDAAWRSVQEAARGAGALAALAELSQVFQDFAGRLRRIEEQTALAERLGALRAALAPCREQVERAGGFVVDFQKLQQDWIPVRTGPWPALQVFLDGSPRLATEPWRPVLEARAAEVEAGFNELALQRLAHGVLDFGSQVARADLAVRQRMSQELAELKDLSDRTLGRFEIAGTPPEGDP
jgi:hypothetical protein